MDDILKFINNIQVVLLYIIPGIIFIKINCFICNKKAHRDNQLIFAGIIISYIIVSFLKIYVSINEYLIVKSIIASIILSILFSFAYKSKAFAKFLINVGIYKSVNDSMWDEIVDEYDTFIKLYISADKVIYHGLYKGHEEKEENAYLLITDYDVTDYDGNCIKDYSNDRRRWATINTRDISRVEITYSAKSERSKKIIKTEK